MSFAKKFEEFIESRNSKVFDLKNKVEEYTAGYEDAFKNSDVKLSTEYDVGEAVCWVRAYGKVKCFIRFRGTQVLFFLDETTTPRRIKSKVELDNLMMAYTYRYMPNFVLNKKEA